MNDEELNKLKLDICKLHGESRGGEVEDVYKRVLDLIGHTHHLHRIIRELASIGSKHSL